mgnify:CR=1 FL=1
MRATDCYKGQERIGNIHMLWRSVASLLTICLIMLHVRMAAAATEPLVETVDLFTVYGIELDVTASTASQARQQAMEEGRQRAFERLLDKLAASGSQQGASLPSEPLLNRLVRSVDVFDERASSTRYLARMNIAFNAEAVQRFLAEAGLAYTESRGGPFLLLPLYESAAGLKLLQPHPWRAAFTEAEPRNRLVDYRLPVDDMKARRLLSPRRVALADGPELSALAERYDLSGAVLARARMMIDPGSGRPSVRYSLKTGQFMGLIHAGEVIARADETEDALMARAAAAVLRHVDEAWKTRTLIAGQERNSLSAVVPLSGLEDWLTVQARLGQVALLRDIDIDEAGLPVSHLTLGYVGSLQQLSLALQQARLSLQPARADADADFVLQMAETVTLPAFPTPGIDGAAPVDMEPAVEAERDPPPSAQTEEGRP